MQGENLQELLKLFKGQGKILNFKSDLPQTPFAPFYNFSMYEIAVPGFRSDDYFKRSLNAEEYINKNYVDCCAANTGLFESTLAKARYYNILKFPEFKEVKNIIRDSYNDYMNQLNLPSENKLYAQAWLNIMREGDEIKPHTHDTTAYSYLSGNLFIKGSNIQTSTYYRSPYDGKIHNSVNEPGKLTLFPSWLDHFTKVYKHKEIRIVLAFDLADEKGFHIDTYEERKDHWIVL